MSVRLLQGVWRLQRFSSLSQRLHCHRQSLSYATGLSLSLRTPAPHTCAPATSAGVPTAVQQARNYAATRAAPSEQSDSTAALLERLETQYKLNGYLIYEQYSKLMDELETRTDPAAAQTLSKEQTIFLLGACGELLPAQSVAERLELCERLWQFLARHGRLTQEHYHTKLRVLQQNRAPLPDLRGLLRDITALDETANTEALYAELLEVACSNGDMRATTEVLATMRERNIALNERHFNALLLGHGRDHDLSGCKSVLDNMSAANITPSSYTQTALVLVHLENSDPAKAVDILEKFQRQFTPGQILRILRSATYVSDPFDGELVARLVRELPQEFLVDNDLPLPLRNLCIELLHSGHLATVVHIIATLPKPQYNENQDIDKFGVFLLQELFRAGTPTQQILETAQLLRDSEKNTRALHIATEIALRRSPATALPFLEALAKEEPLRAHYFWPLLLHNRRRHGENGVVRTLQQMAALNVECSAETVTQYVVPQLQVMLEDPSQAVKTLDGVGLRPAQVLAPIMAQLLTQQKADEVQQLAELYPTKLELSRLITPLCSLAVTARATKRQHHFARLVAALARRNDTPKQDFAGQLLLQMLSNRSRLRNDLNALKRFLSEMQKFDVAVSMTAAEAIKSALTVRPGNERDASDLKAIGLTLHKMATKELQLPSTGQDPSAGLLLGVTTAASASAGVSQSSFIKHPRDMSLDELECHLIELQAKGLNVRGVLRRLLQLCVRDNRLERALEVLQQCEQLRVQTSAGMLASIFDLHIKRQDLPMAQQAVQRLRDEFPGFTIDEHKMIDYAALLVHERQLDEAKRLLKARAETQRVVGGDYVLKNVWNFLTMVANAAAAQTPALPPAENFTRDAFHFLRQLGYCRPHNAVLGPIVREYLLRGDIKAAVAEFRALAECYKQTPLQFELLSLLIRLGNGAAAELERYPVSHEEAQQLLGALTAVIAQVHGAVNMNSALLLAFAESGTETQLRRLLINPEFRINQDQLAKNCEHLGQEGSVQTLVRLARGSRGLHHVVDEQAIYKMLLGRFANENNTAGALQLYEHLEADDELKITQDFLRSLVNLLKVNNVEIPSNIALRAQII